jgi:hypothetical protein
VADPIAPADDPAGLLCQLCGKTAELGDDFCLDIDQGDQVRVRVTIAMSTETSEQDRYRETITSYTICNDCFEHRLAGWFAAQGVQPTVEES